MYYFKKSSLLVVFLCAVIFSVGIIASGVKTVFKSGRRNLPLYSVNRSDNSIALTFNCAWGGEDIKSILQSLEKYKVKATFFVVGEWAEKYPEELKAIAEAGHEIGGHSYNHKDYQSLSREEIKNDIQKTAVAVKESCGEDIKLIRVPSGSYNSDVISAIEEAGYIPIQWSVDSIDYGDADCEGIFLRATSKTRPGDIILMHTGTKNTAAALPRILDSLSGKYEFVTVSELMYKEDYYVDNDGKMNLISSDNCE